MALIPTSRSGEGGILPATRFGAVDAGKAVRFTVTAMAPILLALATGPSHWLAYAMVAGIVAFAGDAGGPASARILWMATGPLALAAGLALGSPALAAPAFGIALASLAGFFYGLVETGHPHLLLAARFLAFGIVLAGLVGTPSPIDYLAIAAMLVFAFAVSIAADRLAGQRRPLGVPPAATILPSLKREPADRWIFALSVALAVLLALLATAPFGAARPSWACLTVLMVMRSEVVVSHRLAVERVAGTLAGVVSASLVAHFADHRAMIVVMALAAFVRWPAQQVHNALGVFCLTLFVLLMVEVVTPDAHAAAALLHERLSDTVIGALAAALGLLFYRFARRLVRRS